MSRPGEDSWWVTPVLWVLYGPALLAHRVRLRVRRAVAR